MEDAAAITIHFGVDGNSEEFVGGGWSVPLDRIRWMTGVVSELRLGEGLVRGGRGCDRDYIIELDLDPLRQPGGAAQRLTVSVNGILIGESMVAHAGRFGYRIPASALAGRQTTSVVIAHPDALRPCDFGRSEDTRLLSVSVERVRVRQVRAGASGRRIAGSGGMAFAKLQQIVGMTPEALMLMFDSLGDNCEFGLVQRRCGAEAFLSLTRFAGMELPTLLRALDAGMRDFGKALKIQVEIDGEGKPEFVVRETRYGVIFHTFRYQGEIEKEQLRAQELKRISYCAHRFVWDLKRGNKIFVVKRNVPLREDEILPLHAALSSYGPNILLWMVPADAAHASGSVEVVMPGLLKGFIERFAPLEDALDLKFDDWLEVSANAYQLSIADDGAAHFTAHIPN